MAGNGPVRNTRSFRFPTGWKLSHQEPDTENPDPFRPALQPSGYSRKWAFSTVPEPQSGSDTQSHTSSQTTIRPNFPVTLPSQSLTDDTVANIAPKSPEVSFRRGWSLPAQETSKKSSSGIESPQTRAANVTWRFELDPDRGNEDEHEKSDLDATSRSIIPGPHVLIEAISDQDTDSRDGSAVPGNFDPRKHPNVWASSQPAQGQANTLDSSSDGQLESWIPQQSGPGLRSPRTFGQNSATAGASTSSSSAPALANLPRPAGFMSTGSSGSAEGSSIVPYPSRLLQPAGFASDGYIM